MLDAFKRGLTLGHRSSYIRAFLARSNMEVMRRSAPVIALMGCATVVTTFFDVLLWQGGKEDIALVHRILYFLIAATAGVFYFLCSRLLRRPKLNVRVAESYTALFVGILAALSMAVTLFDFPLFNRYVFLIMALFVLFGLFFIHPVATLVFNTAVGALMLSGLRVMGLFAPIEVVVLAYFLGVISIVSIANYAARLNAGVVNERIMNASRHDELTGTLNRRAFDEDLKTYLGHDLYLALCDIDEFKYYNDLYGHATGDAILKTFAKVTAKTFGTSRTYHLGGDEYIVVLSGMGEEELRGRIDMWYGRFHDIMVKEREIPATCSAGCVRGHAKTEEEMRDLLRVADMLLFEAKESVRDKAAFAEYSDGLLRKALTKSGTQNIPEANIDPLTGLMDAEYFATHAAEIAPALLERGHSVAVLYINVANLKDYNVRYGFAQGDELLAYVADVLRETFPGRMLSRFGDDRFVVMTDDEGLSDIIGRAAELVRTQGQSALVTLRTGIYRLTDPKGDIRQACDCARIACESLRGHYNVLYRYYSPELGESMSRYNRVLEGFETALKVGYVQPYYQPIVRAVSDQVCEFEVLARWVDPEKGMLSPAEFVPALEEAHLIHQLDLCIVEEVCKNYLRIRERGFDLCPVSINFSRIDFEVCDLVSEVVGILDRYGLPHELIHVELTESAFAEDTEGIKRTLDRFRAEGMQVWMDDFGSGYSALNVLREYDFDVVKFDMSFVRGLDDASGAAGRVMLTNLVSMVKELGLQTLIEGVETLDQLFFLKSISFEKIQGFVFDRPNSFDDLVHKLSERVFVIEAPEKRAYYDAVGKVNLMQPLEPDSPFDPVGLADGLPVAVVEYAEGVVSYLEHNLAYEKYLDARGVADVIEAQSLLNTPDGHRMGGMRAALEATCDTDEWVTVKQGEDALDKGYTRCVARVPGTTTYAVLYFCMPATSRRGA